MNKQQVKRQKVGSAVEENKSGKRERKYWGVCVS